MGWLTRARHDLDAALGNDPAARGRLHVALSYPGVHAIWAHRVANALWRSGLRLPAQLVAMHARRWTGVEIHPAAQLGERLFIDHGMGVVIGETAVLGDDVVIYHGVTLGGTSRGRAKRHPTVGHRVLIGAGATLLGDIHIGDDARIAAMALVRKDVPPGGLVVAPTATAVTSPRDAMA